MIAFMPIFASIKLSVSNYKGGVETQILAKNWKTAKPSLHSVKRKRIR